MNKIASIAFITLFLAASACAEPIDPPASGMIPSKTKIEDLEKLVAEGKARKAGEGAYVLPDKFILNGKEHPKTEYGGAASSQNSEYFLFRDTNVTYPSVETIKLFDKTASLLWKKKYPGGGKDSYIAVKISDKGNVFLLGDTWGSVSSLIIVDKSGQEKGVFSADDLIHGVVIENLYTHYDAQFAKNSEMFFILAYSRPDRLFLLGIDVIGEIKFFEEVKFEKKKDVDGWYTRVYFNPKHNQVLIDSSGIGEEPPMLSYWSFPQKLIFNVKTVKDEVILNASFADNDDILLLLLKKKDGTKTVRRLSPSGKKKYEISDAKKMDVQELVLSKEKLLNVRSLAGCEPGNNSVVCE